MCSWRLIATHRLQLLQLHSTTTTSVTQLMVQTQCRQTLTPQQSSPNMLSLSPFVTLTTCTYNCFCGQFLYKVADDVYTLKHLVKR